MTTHGSDDAHNTSITEHAHMYRIDNCLFSSPHLLDTEIQDGGLMFLLMLTAALSNFTQA